MWESRSTYRKVREPIVVIKGRACLTLIQVHERSVGGKASK